MNLTSSSLLMTRAYIDGRWSAAGDGATFPVRDPASGLEIAQVADCGPEEAEQAVTAAAAALPAWKALPAGHRAAILKQWHAALLANRGALAALISAEEGKPLAESDAEVMYAAAYLEWFAEEARRGYGDFIPAPVADRKLLAIKEPVGVVAILTPWNFPLAMVARKMAPALAAGCTVVAKPASDTPLSALALAQLAEQAGVPRGVVNVVPTSRSAKVVNAWYDNQTVRKVSFTGSTEVGKQVMRRCADTMKRVSLELGGNAPLIIFDDADIDAAVQGALLAKFRNTGQTCVCANRILVQSSVYDAFARKFTEAAMGLKVGPASTGAVDQGPLIDARAVDKVQAHVADALARGAHLMLGGKPHELGGNFFEPTVLTEASSEMLVAREETFGPLAALFRFESEDEAIALANATPYGLAAYFYTRDIRRVWRVAGAIEAGMIGINETSISTEVAPFGGIKESGQGREGSRHGLDDYLEIKYLCMGGLASRAESSAGGHA
ncbi:succinate-semialdehyde dehydrogenase [Cupriavidus sp. SK-4]|uniref:NAD-dependent succinate-semialdehyde dehydrogenase n=1 Tax=Cupriavidus sp. SK-4 TaxID=574750 RepID=UPI0004462239|nr:NAD-dependent succinate-semialdehyde dehydrogenase [Cupriavidus sp. SK-4]EYS96834.1 succinate-semialdehyde dehydrogenase [Cupriavidus sp. SK-4]